VEDAVSAAGAGGATRPQYHLVGIDHIVLRVRDVQRMVRFYVDVIGGALDRVQDDIGLYQVRTGTSLIDLVPVDSPIGREGGAAPGAEGRNMDHVCLRIDPFDGDAIVAWLRACGVDVGEVKSRYGADGDGPSVYLQDPEGNRVELKGRPVD
jgi:glyoxylase I family protein